MPKYRLYALNNPSISFDLAKETNRIGRAKDNDVVVEDPTVSRYQAELTLAFGECMLTSIGRGPMLVNGEHVKEHVLAPNDTLMFGFKRFAFEVIDEEDLPAEETLVTSANKHFDKTIAGDVPAILLELSGEEQGKTYALDTTEFVIGRAEDCDIVLADKRISRKHAVIQKRVSGYYLIRHTEHQAVLVNGDLVDEVKLYNNDRIELSIAAFAFKSFNPLDQKRAVKTAPDGSHSALDGPRSALDSSRSVLDDARLSLDDSQVMTQITRSEAGQVPPPDPQERFYQTEVQPRVVAKKMGPRLVCQNKSGGSTTHSLAEGRNFIGRDSGCQIVVTGDSAVSRSHAVVEEEENVHIVTTLSKNSLLINGHKAKTVERIYSGDTLQIGDTLLTFLSERSEDQRPSKNKSMYFFASLAGLLAIGILSWLLYQQVWTPYQINRQIEAAESRIDDADFIIGLQLLKSLYRENLEPGQRSRVSALMASAINKMVDDEIQRGALEQAKKSVAYFLRQYGAESQVSSVWEKLNQLRFLLALSHERKDELKLALSEYLAIDSGSEYYGKAQQAIREIWLQSQKVEQGVPELPETDSNAADPVKQAQIAKEVDALLAEADRRFQKKYFLSPVQNNAYALYLKVLLLDPDNIEALNRIDQMKTFYQVEGDNKCRLGNRKTAETYFRRYLIIEPENPYIQQRLAELNQCGRDSGAVKTEPSLKENRAGAKVTLSTTESSVNKEKIRKLLADDGVESDWIVEYLFDENSGSANTGATEQSAQRQGETETPW
ncbi:hypothetical protein OLMES_3941 [Oleiphilus messinensis]|uniref:FHA domain-containing protein n=1 Tax=Oleiphilus messinensis TaxID=141451 RepID=A0A1Y0ICH8_9GAMM|nr:FHA domain-containing protein [Oleiphilus messinensis]ARU57960.1 hypothetical protein OLMES_3941 [Oleiphilus messinensis]